MATASVTNTFVTATTINAGAFNTNFSDLVSFLNGSVLHLDGSKTMTGDLDMGTNKVSSLAAATADGDAIRYEQGLLLAEIRGGDLSDNTGYASTTVGSFESPISPTFDTDPGRKVKVFLWGNITVSATTPRVALVRGVIDGISDNYMKADVLANEEVDMSFFAYREFVPGGSWYVDVEWQQTTGTAGDLSLDRAYYTYLAIPAL